MIPFSKSFVNQYKEKPDLYGPFWILTTLIATLFISSNLYFFISNSGSVEEEKNEALGISARSIPVAASIIYGVGFGLPLCMRLLLNLYGTPVQNPNSNNE